MGTKGRDGGERRKEARTVTKRRGKEGVEWGKGPRM